jgi:hypothetical protein
MTAVQYSFFAQRKPARPPPPIERRTHIAVADLLRVAVTPGWLWLHVPNGELRSENTGALLKRMGAKAGVSDFLLIAPPRACVHCLELKRKGLKPTPQQLEFLAQVKAAGGRAGWADSYEDAVRLLRRWGALERLAG